MRLLVLVIRDHLVYVRSLDARRTLLSSWKMWAGRCLLEVGAITAYSEYKHGSLLPERGTQAGSD